MSIANQGRTFSKVTNPEEFCNVDNLLEQGRNIIDMVDPKIVGFLSNFSAASTPPDTIDLPPKAIERLDGAPQDFLIALARYIDFSDISDEVKDRNLQTLAGFVAQRFTAISLIAHSKKLNGETSSFHAARHETVLKSKSAEISALQGDSEIGVKAFSDFMAAGCFFQNAYLTDTNEKAKEAIPRRLEKIGITPA